MFKLESYITPILLSYVDKYIKNFRPEDSQVSLWGGDASFHNLDLRLEVLEQELQLPFSFVSGHIHELLIHVPWTKLASEPITITINTIECILKLRGAESLQNLRKDAYNKEKQKKQANRPIEAPPGYVQLLINKIVSNIRIYCNNLILKYVEEDIVLSMNIKLLTFESADEKWQPAYTEIFPAQVILRKLIAVNDLTVCLDKRNASGKIDVYQEPMLYRCSMVIHLLRNYHHFSSKRTSTTRLDIYCNSMEFSMTEQQIPMLLRLLFLLQVLHQKQLKSDTEVNKDAEPLQVNNSEYLAEKLTFAGWAWSWVPSILPVRDEEEEREQHIANLGNTLHIGFYVDNASLTFKVSESSQEKGGYYSQKKLKYWPLVTLRLQGIFTDCVMHGKQWSQVSMGVSQMLLIPIGHCSCSQQDVFDNLTTTEYLKAGSVSTIHKSESLFDVEAPENKGQRKSYNTNWDQHIEMTSEAALLERSPALAFDYLYQLIIPEEMTSENLSELGSDLEYSNLTERALMRIVVGPLRLRICSGFIHRMSSLQAAASAYDYIPYSIPKPEPELSDLPPPSEDDYDALNENIPMRVLQFTILAPVIEFQLMDHPYFKPTKSFLFKKRKKTSVNSPSPNQKTVDLPKITLECQCVDIRISQPMYVRRLVRTTCQLPDPPAHMFETCYVYHNIKVISLCSRLIISNRQITILTPSNASFYKKTIIMPEYWIDPSIPHEEITMESDSITVTGTNPKIVIIVYILDKLFKMDCEDSFNYIANSSILQDATRNFGLVYLELCIEAIRLKKVKTNTTITIDTSLGSIKAFIFEPIDFVYNKPDGSTMQLHQSTSNSSFYSTREIQQVLIISGPEFKDDYKNIDLPKDEPLFTTTIQIPINPDNQTHPPILLFNLREIRMCIDPLLCKWLLYTPRNLPPKTEVIYDSMQRKMSRTYSDISGCYDTPKRYRTAYESIHSSFEQSTLVQEKNMQAFIESEDVSVDFQEKTYNFLKRWFDVWKGLLLYGDISQCTIYFPVKSLSAVGSQGIQQAVDEAMKKEDPPDIFIFSWPSAIIRNSAHRDNLTKYITTLPVSLPEHLWTKSKSSFPWSIVVSELSCYTWQNGNRLNCLAPSSLTATVGMSTKSSKSSLESEDVLYENKMMDSLLSGNLSSSKHDIGSLGVCIHIDMTPILISISEVQVCLIASILHGLVEVVYNILPEPQPEVIKVETIPQASSHFSTISPTLLKESVESVSEKSSRFRTDNVEPDNIKLTAWIQWTITRFSIELLAHDSKEIKVKDGTYATEPKLKFVIEAEDIVSSLDFQSVYLKLKSKIGSSSIMHYVKEDNDKWSPGEFLGFVMRSNEESSSPDRQEDTSFAKITVTRASCHHTHNLWGTSKMNKTADKKTDEKLQKHSRYITEIVISLQQIDILLSPTTLKNYFLVLEPLLKIPTLTSAKTRKSPITRFHLSNRTLPLTYVEFHGFRFIMPSVKLGAQNTQHNVCVFQISAINLTPTAVNPICRTPCRPDIYQQAAQARILNVPGSDVEDRQYQLDVIGISMNTGSWKEISQIINTHGKSMSVLRTMSENPALEWNNLEKSKIGGNNPDVTLWPLIGKFDISIVAAPAMIYKHDVICGHSVEINFISDIKFTVSLSQIKLLFAILNESSYAFEILASHQYTEQRPKVVFPYPQYNSNIDSDKEIEIMDFTRDSGIETADFRSTSYSMKTKESSVLRKMSDLSEKSGSIGQQTSPAYGKSLLITSHSYVPLELLITGGKVTFVMYEYEKSNRRSDMMSSFTDFGDRESDKGYEASEEGSSDEKPTIRKFVPLIYLSLSQPNAFLSDSQMVRKIKVSCFDISIKISGSEHKTLKGVPGDDDFHMHLLETKSGEPNPDTGVLPAFLTIKWSKGLGIPACLDLDIAKPTKIFCSISRAIYLLQIQKKIVDNFKIYFDSKVEKQHKDIKLRDVEVQTAPSVKGCDYYSKFKEIKERFMGITVLNINLSQIILTVQTDPGIELTLSFSKMSNHFTITNRPEKIVNMMNLDCFTLGVTKEMEKKLIFNPLSVKVEISLFWESWQSINSSPQIQISAESDCIVLDISPDKIQSAHLLFKDISEFIQQLPRNYNEYVAPVEVIRTPLGEKEQHYKDDLRAGAFQFVDSISNNIDELPLPYQVMFWNRNISAMAWRYPQPRALTKVRIFPVPFKISTGNEEDQQVLCHLEYWSDCHNCYQPCTQFYLSETEMCHLELPKNYPQPAVACTWRVVLTTPSMRDYNQSRVLISPRALAGCIRVDSYFNKNLIPELTMALHIGSININFLNYFDKKLAYTLPESLNNFTPDLCVPDYQQFLTLTIDNCNVYLATWNFEMAIFDINATTKLSILDYGFLTTQLLMEPFTSKLEISVSKSLGVSFISKPIHIMFGASAAHTLTVSAQMWMQNFTYKSNTDNYTQDLIITTNYVICNDTNVNLRFGQAGLEDIFLPSRYCHLYAWRSQKCKQMIRVALEEKSWVWSEPFRIDIDGTELYKIADDTGVIIVTVKSLSITQKQIVFSGQLFLCNTLIEHFEMKIVKAVDKDREREFKNAFIHILRGKSTPPSLLLDCNNNYFLRLRFFGLESAWSGDIPLMENTKCAQPWLVKVPLQERGQFLSIWCRIVVQNFAKGSKILALLWPLFMIRSNLPTSAKVHIETPTLNVHLESTIRGLGEYQQLYCPGTIDHSHQLTFQLDSGTSSSNPYVPLNYSLVDQKLFFKKCDNEDIDEILALINDYDKSYWPYFKEDIDDVEFSTEDQPLTHVQVRYQNACLYSSALLVELLPWSLMVNTLGCSIAIIINEKELCRINHHGIITPPKLEETFYIGVGIGGTWNMSSPLQLAKSNWSQTFYMPQITGTIPLEGIIKTVVKCEPYICVVTIISSILNEIRLLRVCSSHVITSFLKLQLQVMCFAVPENQTNTHLPRHLEKHAFALPSNLNNSNIGISIIQWYSLGSNDDINMSYALYVSFATLPNITWSCPVRVDKFLIRKSIVVDNDECSVPIVVVAQEYKGQIYLSVHHDMHPQLRVNNQSGTRIYCAQSGGENSTIINDSDHFNWLCAIDDRRYSYYTMPIVSQKFPELPQNNYVESLVLASDPEGDPQGFLWSLPINVTSFNDQFVRIPFYGDVKVSVKYSVHTIHVLVESVSQVEISARDIRVRLLLHENESSNQGISANTKEICDLKASDSSTTVGSTYFSARDSESSSSTDLLTMAKPHARFDLMPIVKERPTTKVYIPHLELGNDIAPKEWSSMRVLVFIEGITFTMTSDIENGGAEKTEVASLTLDYISLTITRAEVSQICLSVSDVQVDNQLYSRGSYDFPVLLIGQETRHNSTLKSLNVPIIQLVHNAQNNCLMKIDLNVETWRDEVLQKYITDVRDLKIQIEPLSAYIEDTYVMKLIEYVSVLQPAKLVMWPKIKKTPAKMNAMCVIIPEHLICGSTLLANPLTLKTFHVEPVAILLSIHSSIKIYIALDQSPLQFGKFDKRRLFTTNYRLGHALTMHYLSGAIFGAGWVVGSLELLGSPGGLARAMGNGLHDFVTLPYYGFVQGPWAFLIGVSYGSASLMKHITAGTLQSVTKLASSVARNLDRLTLDQEHLQRTEESRRQRPQGLTQGFMQGLTGLGISLLGAVGGIAHHPLQSVMAEGVSPRSLVAGVGKGIVGVITKPLSGAAELLALTGQGLLQGAGWSNLPEPRMNPVLNHIYSTPNSIVKYKWKFMQYVTQSNILFITEATSITNISQYDAVVLVLTTEALVIIDIDEDMSQRVLSLSELTGVNNNDPTLLCLKLEPPKVTIKTTEEEIIEMDPACRARVADYVRSTVGLMQLPDNLTPEHSEMSISPDLTPSDSPNGGGSEQTLLTFYVNPQSRNYFLCLLSLSKQQTQNYNFPVL